MCVSIGITVDPEKKVTGSSMEEEGTNCLVTVLREKFSAEDSAKLPTDISSIVEIMDCTTNRFKAPESDARTGMQPRSCLKTPGQ